MVQLCAHLFWSRPLEGDSKEGDEAPPVQPSDDKRALECLQVSEGYPEGVVVVMQSRGSYHPLRSELFISLL